MSEIETTPRSASAPCPRCGTPRNGHDRYCEDCGHDFVAPAWSALVTVDAEHFARQAPAGLALPDPPPGPRHIVLERSPVVLGRGADIDLGGDPAVSRRHASLVRFGDGWAVIDEGSSNGTSVNDGPEIEPHVAIALHDGDRVHVGAWTTLELRTRSA